MLRHLSQQGGLHLSHGLPHLDPIQTTGEVRKKVKFCLRCWQPPNTTFSCLAFWEIVFPKNNYYLISLTGKTTFGSQPLTVKKQQLTLTSQPYVQIRF